MKKTIRIWTIITIILASIAIGIIVTSMFIDMQRLITIGLAFSVFSQITSLHVRCLKKKMNQ